MTGDCVPLISISKILNIQHYENPKEMPWQTRMFDLWNAVDWGNKRPKLNTPGGSHAPNFLRLLIAVCWSWAHCEMFLCLEQHTNEAKGSIQWGVDLIASFACQTADNCDKSYLLSHILSAINMPCRYFKSIYSKMMHEVDETSCFFSYINFLA